MISQYIQRKDKIDLLFTKHDKTDLILSPLEEKTAIWLKNILFLLKDTTLLLQSKTSVLESEMIIRSLMKVLDDERAKDVRDLVK